MNAETIVAITVVIWLVVIFICAYAAHVLGKDE